MPIRVSISTIGFPLVMWSYPRLSATKVNGVVGCVKPRVAVFRRAGRTFPSMDWAPEVVSFDFRPVIGTCGEAVEIGVIKNFAVNRW